MQIAILGMGKMGRNLAEKLMLEGHNGVVWNRSSEILETMRLEKASYIVSGKMKIARQLDELRDSLSKPPIVWSMLPAGEVTEEVMGLLQQGVVDQADIVID